MKPHIKVIQRNGIDVFVTSSVEYKFSKRQKESMNRKNIFITQKQALSNNDLLQLAPGKLYTPCNETYQLYSPYN